MAGHVVSLGLDPFHGHAAETAWVGQSSGIELVERSDHSCIVAETEGSDWRVQEEVWRVIRDSWGGGCQAGAGILTLVCCAILWQIP